jgi:hypothetical protein
MKQVLMILSIAAVMVSCKSKSADDTKVLSATQQAEYEKLKAESDKKAATPVVIVKEVPVKTVVVKEETAAVPVRKKGWSKAAKGAVIGAGTGAIAGAIINKRNRGAGAVIGGVVGGGVGYGIGRSKDKKDGRVKN